jgi:putative sterol carrier protein
MTLDELYSKIIAKTASLDLGPLPDAQILIRISLGGGDGKKNWLASFLGGKVSFGEIGLNGAETPDVTVDVSEETILKVAGKQLAPAVAFFSGQIKLSGNMELLGRLKHILPD